MERPRLIDRLDITILVITVIGATAVAFLNDREISRYLREKHLPEAVRLSPQSRTFWASVRHVESDFKAIVAVATLGGGLAVLIRPGRLRTRRWPGPGVAAMAVGAVAVVYMIAWNIQLVLNGHHRYSHEFPYMVVSGTVERIQCRTTGVIIGAWVVLAVARRWRPRAELLDRLGLVLGGSWIALDLLNLLAPHLRMLSL